MKRGISPTMKKTRISMNGVLELIKLESTSTLIAVAGLCLLA